MTLEEICDLRQPVIFDFECNKIVETSNLSYISNNYGVFEIKVRNIEDNDENSDLYIPLPVHSAIKLFEQDKSASYFSENNKEFLEKIPEVVSMESDITQFIEKWLPHYIADGRSYLTIAIGCTGGQHRSVYLVNRISKHFHARKDLIDLQLNFLDRHRELDSIPATKS